MSEPIIYKGPTYLDDDICTALNHLNDLLSFSVTQCTDHCMIIVNGLDQREAVVTGIAIYLAGAIASCISFNLNIRAALFDEETINRELYRDIVKVVGDDNNIDERRKTYTRNPWLWEGISHLLLHLSLKNRNCHPPETLLAKNSIHLDVNDHGLDVIALYGTDAIGVTAGECKAYLDRPADAVADAANKLREVDRELRDAEIRAVLSQFRPCLSTDQQLRLAGAFWHNERAYFPMVCCESCQSIDWAADRVVLKRLKPPVNRKYLVAAAINEAEEFFDAVSDEMRRYARDHM